MTAVIATCKLVENKQYSRRGPLLGGFVFFGNRFGVKAFLPVWMQMARLKQEQDLFESERSFRLLVEGVADYALYMLDPEGIVTSWNIGGQRIKGYLPEEIVGQHFSRFYTPADQANGKPARALEHSQRSTAVTKKKAGASARTARSSGRASSSTPSRRTAGLSALPR